MYYDFAFWWSLASLSLIIVYAVLVFKDVDPLVATAIGVALGFIFNKSTPLEIGNVIAKSLTSFLALIGFIIMLGRGLGEVLSETKVSHTLVHKIVYSIGINTKRRVKIGVIISSIIIVGVLGTIAGGLAIIAPILRPIAGKVGLSRPSLAILMQASAEEALILGPFAPPVVAILGVTGLSYPKMLIYASIPIAAVTLVVTWIMANRLQKQFANELFEESDQEQFIPSKRQKLTTSIFILGFLVCVMYGLVTGAKTSYVVFVMLFLAISTGFCGGLNLNKIFGLLVEGMKKNFHLFFIFLLLDPFLNLVQSAGGFKALTALFLPLEHLGGKSMIAILTGITGAFGMPAAAAAVIKMLYEMFSPVAIQMQLSMTTFAFSILLATRITNFAYPGANMFAAMGFAESKNIKAMIKNGLTVTMVQVIFLVIYSLLFA
ncbi:MAG: permease [Burkholderiales bacterium]|jgi:H+/gluconate symporter-like permease|nr:permease [Burkholderiales bacterium]